MTIDGKTNEFKLTGGETIKLGRVRFTVREIETQEDENQTDYDSFDNNLRIDENAEAALGHILPDRENFHSFENNNNINHDDVEEEKKENEHIRNDINLE